MPLPRFRITETTTAEDLEKAFEAHRADMERRGHLTGANLAQLTRELLMAKSRLNPRLAQPVEGTHAPTCDADGNVITHEARHHVSEADPASARVMLQRANVDVPGEVHAAAEAQGPGARMLAHARNEANRKWREQQADDAARAGQRGQAVADDFTGGCEKPPATVGELVEAERK